AASRSAPPPAVRPPPAPAKAAGAAADVDDALVGRRGEGRGPLTQRAVSVSDPAAVVEERRAQHASSHRVDATVIPSTARDVYASFIVGWIDRATPTRSLARRHLPWYTPSAMPRAESVARASVLLT